MHGVVDKCVTKWNQICDGSRAFRCSHMLVSETKLSSNWFQDSISQKSQFAGLPRVGIHVSLPRVGTHKMTQLFLLRAGLDQFAKHLVKIMTSSCLRTGVHHGFLVGLGIGVVSAAVGLCTTFKL